MRENNILVYHSLDQEGKLRTHTLYWHMNIEEEIRMLEILSIHYIIY